MKKPVINEADIITLAETKFLNAYDMQYAKGAHYYVASRRNKGDLTAVKSLEEIDCMLPDAVTCYIVLRLKDREPKLLLQYEYRFPIGQFVLCPPAGIIDSEDEDTENALLAAAKREIFEETGIRLKASDKLFVINELVFSTPGFTDECNALVAAEVELDDLSELSHGNAEGTELFGDFVLLTKEDCIRLLKTGRDPGSHHYPLYACAAMSWFALNY